MTKKQILEEHRKLLCLIQAGVKIVRRWKSRMPAGLLELEDENLIEQITECWEPFTLVAALVGKFQTVPAASIPYKQARERIVNMHCYDPREQACIFADDLGKALAINPELIRKMRSGYPGTCATLRDIAGFAKRWSQKRIQEIFRQDTLLTDYMKAGIASRTVKHDALSVYNLLKLIAAGANVHYSEFCSNNRYFPFGYEGFGKTIGISSELLVDIAELESAGYADLRFSPNRVIGYLEAGVLGVFPWYRLAEIAKTARKTNTASAKEEL